MMFPDTIISGKNQRCQKQTARGRKMPSIPCCTLGVQRSARHNARHRHRRSEHRKCKKRDNRVMRKGHAKGWVALESEMANCGLRATPSRLFLWAPETKNSFYTLETWGH